MMERLEGEYVNTQRRQYTRARVDQKRKNFLFALRRAAFSELRTHGGMPLEHRQES